MFTGIVEEMGVVESVVANGTNKTFFIRAALAPELQIDQSVAHDGVCLTVEVIAGNVFQVTAIAETLAKTALGNWAPGSAVNLERSLLLNARVDGHFVQGHVDTTGVCEAIADRDGSYELTFSFPHAYAALVIEKGSICVNGVSLTAWNVTADRFSVGVIPYTWAHTNLRRLRAGSAVNLEFDMLGKYILRRMALNS